MLILAWLLSLFCIGLSFRAGRSRRFIRYPLCAALVLAPSLAQATDGTAMAAPDADLVDILLSILPQSWEAWTGVVIIVCAILAAVLPRPPKTAHPAWHVCHRIICCLGLGASKVRGRIGVDARVGSALRRK